MFSTVKQKIENTAASTQEAISTKASYEQLDEKTRTNSKEADYVNLFKQMKISSLESKDNTTKDNTTIDWQPEIDRMRSKKSIISLAQLEAKLSVIAACRLDLEEFKFTVTIFETIKTKISVAMWKENSVAVKTISLNKQSLEFSLAKCRHEADLMSQLTGEPNIIRYIGYHLQMLENERDTLYQFHIMMEYATRGSLRDIISDNLPLSWERRYQFIDDAAHGLSRIHAHDIIHRDMKSANLLIDSNWRLKIADFGISIYKNTRNPFFAGTAIYMAPESLAKTAYTEKSDVFSLALVACEVVLWDLMKDLLPTNIVLSGNNDNKDELYNYLISGKRIDLPRDNPITQLITWGWKTEPEERPSADEFLSEMKSQLQLK